MNKQKLEVNSQIKRKELTKCEPNYKKFKLSQLFNISGTKSLDEGNLEFIKTGINFVGRVDENNGVKGKIKKQAYQPNEPFTITATVIGNYKYVKYQTEPYYCSQNINKLVPKFKINTEIALYFITLINKFTSAYNGQQGGYKLKELQEYEILLPINKNNEIDYIYIEKYIRRLQKECLCELEEKRVNELEYYLNVSGLVDYELTKDDKLIINRDINFKDFKLEDILKWQQQKEINPLSINRYKVDSNEKYPFYGQSTTNNGIISYLHLTKNVLNNKYNRPTILIHSNNQNVVYLDTPFYLKDGHGATSVLQNDKLNKFNALYIITCISKVITKKFNYDNKATKIALKNTKISLPVNENNEIDYEFMEAYIKIIQKLVIKNVVDERDKQINAAKHIVNS